MELIADGTCSRGHALAVYESPDGEWEVDGGSDLTSPDEDREDHLRVTCKVCWDAAGNTKSP